MMVPSPAASRKPPIPPAMPIRPVITPISWRKRCGTSWNTAPLPAPKPSMALTNRARAAVALGRLKPTAAMPTAATLYIASRVRMPPKRSARAPPSGRIRLPAKTQAAV
ncbi:hypothetical protein D3C71_1856470 [compost metagenome]